MKLSIIIVTYNSEHYIKQCLSSLLKLNTKNKNYDVEIIIVDNFSSDNALQTIKMEFPQVTVKKNRENLGFADAANQGAKIAKGDYLLFLNPDTVVKADCIEEMVNFLKKKKDAAVVGCKVLNTDGTLQPSCGSFPTISNIIFDRISVINILFKTELIRQANFYNKEKTPDWISGVFFMVKKDIFEKLGGFDERYFLYVEDVDFCCRARKAGFKIYYNPKAQIIHYDQGRSKERRPFKAKQMRKGFSIFFEKYKSPLYFFIWRTILTIESLFKPSLREN